MNRQATHEELVRNMREDFLGRCEGMEAIDMVAYLVNTYSASIPLIARALKPLGLRLEIIPPDERMLPNGKKATYRFSSEAGDRYFLWTIDALLDRMEKLDGFPRQEAE